MNYSRRKDDQNIDFPLPANVEGRFATIEATFKNQGRLLEDFIWFRERKPLGLQPSG